MEKEPSSFRDASGYVCYEGDDVYRVINTEFKRHWEAGERSGFLERVVARKLVTAFREVGPFENGWKTLKVERIPFISYPYEWCFDQLKDAALLTLSLQKEALRHCMTLKDASAYNVQFRGAKPVFIDLLSFEERVSGEPWAAYRQFCQHFLAPLSLSSYVDLSCGGFSKLWIDGIPLGFAARLMPWRTKLRFGLLTHLFLHATMEHKHSDSAKSAARAKSVTLSAEALGRIVDNLGATIGKLRPYAAKTEWGDYYSDTNYSDKAEAFKLEFVEGFAEKCSSSQSGADLAVDLGANTGRYSRALARRFRQVLAVDVDPFAVNQHYLRLKKEGPDNILPLILDLANPSPSIGWACEERVSFADRCEANALVALALIHHLVIGCGIPMVRIADYFAGLLAPGGMLLLEFVPKSDSQMRRLLAVRKDVFFEYSLEGMREAFDRLFVEVDSIPIPETVRTMHVFRKK